MKLDGPTLYAMMLSASNALNNNREAINNMNVFPVPDGDTGINMSLTLDAVKQIDDPQVKVSDLSKKIASVILRAARGNSGAIISLFFRGMSKAFVDVEEVDSEDVARAFRKGTDEAYRAVMNPTEGTILTVMRKCTEAAEQAAAEGRFKGDVRGMFEYIVDIGDEALAHTPDQLPILKEVNVVDAGGYGFMTALNGMLSALNKKPVELINDTPAVENEADFTSFDTENITFPYCTECIVEKEGEFVGEGHADALHEFLGGIGDSLVFAEDESIIKVHVHTDHPGQVLEKAGEYGMLVTVKVENMRKQHSALVASDKEVKKAQELEKAPVIAEPTGEMGFVSVCMGEGVKATFLDLGVDTTIFGGQTMNPSTQDIIDGILKTPAKTVFVLPNNKNIYLVALQAAKLVKDRRVIVVETRSVPQGITSMINYNPELSADENLEAMNEAIKSVKSIAITHAVRDTVIEGEHIENGQMLGLLDGKIAHVANTNEECVESIIGSMDFASFVTVFYGEDISEEQAGGVVEIIANKLPDAEIALVNGGQPIYTYIISVE